MGAKIALIIGFVTPAFFQRGIDDADAIGLMGLEPFLLGKNALDRAPRLRIIWPCGFLIGVTVKRVVQTDMQLAQMDDLLMLDRAELVIVVQLMHDLGSKHRAFEGGLHGAADGDDIGYWHPDATG